MTPRNRRSLEEDHENVSALRKRDHFAGGSTRSVGRRSEKFLLRQDWAELCLEQANKSQVNVMLIHDELVEIDESNFRGNGIETVPDERSLEELEQSSLPGSRARLRTVGDARSSFSNARPRRSPRAILRETAGCCRSTARSRTKRELFQSR